MLIGEQEVESAATSMPQFDKRPSPSYYGSGSSNDIAAFQQPASYQGAGFVTALQDNFGKNVKRKSVQIANFFKTAKDSGRSDMT